LEEATQSLNRNQTQEDEEERVAADAEKRKRLMNKAQASSASTEEVALRRVKILMLGDSGVGKSSLVNRWTLDSYKPSLTSTVGVNFKSKKVKIKDECVQVQVWDTAGQEQFHKITTSYYKGAQAIMLVYDVSDIKSLDGIEYWVKNIKSHASETVQVVLVGNKIDLRHSDPNLKYVETEQGKDVSARFGIPFFETSAKDSSNVNDAFCTLVEHTIHVAEMHGKQHFTLLSSTSSPGGIHSASVGHSGARPSIEASMSKMLGAIPHLLSRDNASSSSSSTSDVSSSPLNERRGVGLGTSPNDGKKTGSGSAASGVSSPTSGSELGNHLSAGDGQKPSFNSLSPSDKEKCLIS
jgi:small GTP-binding protein